MADFFAFLFFVNFIECILIQPILLSPNSFRIKPHFHTSVRFFLRWLKWSLPPRIFLQHALKAPPTEGGCQPLLIQSGQFITMASVIVYDFQGWIIKFDWCHTLLKRTQPWKVLATMWTAPHPRGYCGYKDQPRYQCAENKYHESQCDGTVPCCFKLSWFWLQTMSLEGEGVFRVEANLVVCTAEWCLKQNMCLTGSRYQLRKCWSRIWECLTSFS